MSKGKSKTTSYDPALAALARATNRLADESEGMEKAQLRNLARKMAKAAGKPPSNQLNFAFDPELIAMGAELAAFHIEAGARSFSAYSRAMIEDLGEEFRPYLRQWYEAVRYQPGFDAAADMTPAAEINEDIDDVSGTSSNLERDRADADTTDAVRGENVSSGRRGTGQGAGSRGGRTGGRGGQPSTSGVVPESDAAPVGERGDSELSGGSPTGDGGAAERGGRERGGDSGLERLPDGRVPEEATSGTVESAADVADAAAQLNNVLI